MFGILLNLHLLAHVSVNIARKNFVGVLWTPYTSTLNAPAVEECYLGVKDNTKKRNNMTLEEAIIHCKEKACGNTQCALEHRQLAEWLQELQQYRKNARK